MADEKKCQNKKKTLVQLYHSIKARNKLVCNGNTFTGRHKQISYHVVGPVSDWLVPRGRNALFGVSVAEAASLHDHVIDGKVTAGQRFVCGGGVFGLARTRLVFQQSDSDVGHP